MYRTYLGLIRIIFFSDFAFFVAFSIGTRDSATHTQPHTTHTTKMSTEQTYIMIKPDGVQRGLVGKIIERFETKGFKLVAMKLCSPGKAHMESHYADLAGKKFFPGLIEYMVSGPVVCMVRCQCTRSPRGSVRALRAFLFGTARFHVAVDRSQLCAAAASSSARSIHSPSFPSFLPFRSFLCAQVWQGANAVLTGRKMLGATKPFDSDPGTIRGDFCIDVGRNICHGSDAVESAEKEIALWFTPEEVSAWTHHSAAWVYE
jgi:nucleoside-diphosphate kinase